jgi:hypothetical protein
MKPGSGPSPVLGLIAALAVLIAGIAAALTRDDSTSTRTSRPGIVASTRPLPASSATTLPSTTGSTFTTLPATALSTTTTVRPAVPTPEAAANGLWAAYTAGDKAAAQRFASPAVMDALFSTPFSGEEGTFHSCTKRQSEPIFDCEYQQPSTRYTMTAQADAASSFKIVQITIAG